MYRTVYTIIVVLIATSLFAQTTTTFQGNSVMVDSWLDRAAVSINYGSADSIRVHNAITTFSVGVIKLTTLLDSIPAGATIIACSLSIYATSVQNATLLSSRRLCKSWVESEVTYTDWKTATAWTFGSAQSKGADCVACNNSGDGSGDDHIFTEGTVNISTTGWATIPIDTCHANAWLNETDANNGIMLHPKSNFDEMTFSSSESLSNKPKFIVVWTEDSGVPNSRHSGDGNGIKHSGDGASARHGG